MAQYWQEVQDRAVATLAVWESFFSDLALGRVGPDPFSDQLTALTTLAQARDNQVQAVDGARQAEDFAETALRLAELGVPKIIEGVVDEESGLLDDLDKVYAVPPWSPAKVVERGQLLVSVWAVANAWQTSRTPPRAAIVRGTMTQAAFATKLTTFPSLSQAVVATELALSTARGDLRRAAAAVDRLNKRFLKAARGSADEGTPAWDALNTIPVESASPLPDTLSIRTFSQGGAGGLKLLVTYEPYDDDSAETKLLQWMIEGVDAGWDHEVAVDPTGQALGPFVVGQTVRVRTKVTNPSGTRESGPRQLTILAPPV